VWRESRKVRRQDELRLGDRVAATLRWQGLLSTFATGRTMLGAWTFDRPRLLSRDVEVRDAASNALVATYRERWRGDGTLEFTDGRAIDWAPTNFWQTDWAFFDADDRPLISFVDTSRWFEARTRVTYHRVARADAQLSASDDALLTTLGRYLTVLKRNDTAAIAASTAAVVSA
jgi:hypothetical protein